MKRNLWPYAIILYFIIFISGMVSWIAFAMRNDHELVRKDYYEQEIKFQSEMEKRARSSALRIKVAYDAPTRRIEVRIPGAVSTGTILFYRPSNAKLDRELKIVLKDGSQTIDVRGFESGLWKVRLSWTANSEEYRHEESIVL